MKCCGNCEYRRQSKLKIQFNEIPITACCDNKNSPYYDTYIWDDEICDEWKGANNNKECHKPESLYYRAYCEERKDSTYCDGCEFWY